jgi:hypothetical protein
VLFVLFVVKKTASYVKGIGSRSWLTGVPRKSVVCRRGMSVVTGSVTWSRLVVLLRCDEIPQHLPNALLDTLCVRIDRQ